MVQYFKYFHWSNDIISLFGQTIISGSLIQANWMPLVCFLSLVPKALTDTRTGKACSTGTCQNEVKSWWRCGMQAKLTRKKFFISRGCHEHFPSIYRKEQSTHCRSSTAAVWIFELKKYLQNRIFKYFMSVFRNLSFNLKLSLVRELLLSKG